MKVEGGASAGEIEARIEDVERRLERLRGLYESFFMGVERTPPHVPRRELNRLFVEMQQEPLRSPILRFRFQSLLQKWVLLTTYWNRTMREIEAGTYRRDLAKAQRHLAQRGGAITEADAVALGIPASRARAFVAHQDGRRARQAARAEGAAAAAPVPEAPPVPSLAAPPPVASGSAPAPAAAQPPSSRAPRPEVPGWNDEALAAFYGRYADAHARTGGASPKMTLDQMRARLALEIPRILTDKRCARVDLDVEVDGGRVRLKAKPVRG